MVGRGAEIGDEGYFKAVETGLGSAEEVAWDWDEVGICGGWGWDWGEGGGCVGC
jgi:hypothetical protein